MGGWMGAVARERGAVDMERSLRSAKVSALLALPLHISGRRVHWWCFGYEEYLPGPVYRESLWRDEGWSGESRSVTPVDPFELSGEGIGGWADGVGGGGGGGSGWKVCGEGMGCRAWLCQCCFLPPPQ